MEAKTKAYVYDDPDDEQLESMDEVAQILGVCRMTIHNWIKAGHLKSVRVGGRRMIPRGERRRFVREQMSE